MTDQSKSGASVKHVGGSATRNSTSIVAALVKRRAAWIIFAIALVVRLSFLIFEPQPPVQFDARRYVGTGLALPIAITDWGLMTDPKRQFEVDFNVVMQELIQDEQIEWLLYRPPTLKQAVDDVFFAGPVYPTFLGIVFRLAPRYDFTIVRILQGLIDACSAALLCAWLARLFMPGIGLFAGGLYAFYGASIAKVGELTLEVPTIFLIMVAIVVLTKAFEDQKYRLRWMGFLGFIWVMLVLLRVIGAGLFVPLLLAWWWGMRRRPREALFGTLTFLVVAGICLAPWVWSVHSRYGTFGARNPEYAGGNLRSSNMLDSEGYDLDEAFPDYWTYPVMRMIQERPVDYMSLYLRKIYRVWFRPYDDFARQYPFGEMGNLWYHRALILAGLFGLFLWPRVRGPDQPGKVDTMSATGGAVVLVVGYFVALHAIFHAMCRYNMPAMPLVIAAAAVGLTFIVRPDLFGVSQFRQNVFRRAVIATGFIALIVGVCYFAFGRFRPPVWFAWFESATPDTARNLYLAAGLVGLIVAVALMKILVGRKGLPWSAAAVLALFIGCMFLARQSRAENWSEWKCTLREPSQSVVRTIEIDPEHFSPPSSEEGFRYAFSWDARVVGPEDFRIIVDLDQLHHEVNAEDLVKSGSFPFPWVYVPFMKEHGDKVPNVRQWVKWLISDEDFQSIAEDGTIEISVRVAPKLGHRQSTGTLEIYGDCLTTEDGTRWGPSYRYSSVERYYEGKDPRIWIAGAREEVPSQNSYCIIDSCITQDLSPLPGRQVGEYRLMFTILDLTGEVRHY